ncbi:predicted protein [Uncinocarpus reesii 1704]|uniref:DUF7707 domain-containing protein n=1 Tax=Uncinocarpus reesii (strain UAMH 1704) TaxID=336963 RepID=C4K033_UNCRE|nr:uncharacterized protein UREG_07784 [Uncinocarpus reesii 1704]EEP82919.1 predicted protein [Uncinocarpus reesii 1704]
MLSSALVVAASLLTAAVSAQQSYTPPPGFDPSLVNPSEKSAWCQGQLDTCPKICESFAKTNRCDASRLTFECVCGNGTAPDVESYKNTLPYFICQANFGQCINRHPNDLDGQRECKEAQKSCGTLDAGGSSSTTSTTRSSITSAPTRTRVVSSSASSAAATTTSAAAAVHMAQDYSLRILAALFAGAFGFLA